MNSFEPTSFRLALPDEEASGGSSRQHPLGLLPRDVAKVPTGTGGGDVIKVGVQLKSKKFKMS